VCLRSFVFIVDINYVLDIFENFGIRAYADDLKLYLRVGSTDDCRLFQQDLNRLQGLCSGKKFDLNVEKCKFISISRGSKPVMFQYVIDGNDLQRVDVINDLGILVDSRMIFVKHIDSIVSTSAIMTLTSIKLCMWLLSYASCVWSPHQDVHSARIERIQHIFIRFALRGLNWMPLVGTGGSK
jgi:hypothetical protein